MSLTRMKAFHILLFTLIFSSCDVPLAWKLRDIDKRIEAVHQMIRSNALSPTADREKEVSKKLVDLIIQLEGLSARNIENADVEWRIGECQRLAYQLDLPEAWTQAERHFKLALACDPAYTKAHLSLGQLYLESGFDMLEKSEKHFLEALRLSSQAPLPEAHRGLFYVYSYLGRFQESLVQAEKYLALQPNDAEFLKAKQLAEVNLKIKEKTKIK